MKSNDIKGNASSVDIIFSTVNILFLISKSINITSKNRLEAFFSLFSQQMFIKLRFFFLNRWITLIFNNQLNIHIFYIPFLFHQDRSYSSSCLKQNSKLWKIQKQSLKIMNQQTLILMKVYVE
jgi:hypothetical protein